MYTAVAGKGSRGYGVMVMFCLCVYTDDKSNNDLFAVCRVV